MEQKGIIFDLDGVIVNTAKYHYLGWKKLADEIHIPFDEKRNEKLKGLSRRDSLLALLEKTPDEKTIQQYCDRKNNYYKEFISQIDRSELLPGALEIIEEIKKNPEWKQALASSSKNARPVLKKLDIEKYFDAVVDGTETERTKPDPELFLKSAQKLNIPPERAIVVEDAESGVQAAKAGGMLVIGMGETEILHEADLVIKDLSQIDITKIEKLFEKSGAENKT